MDFLLHFPTVGDMLGAAMTPLMSHAHIVGVLAGVVALGGSYGDYRVQYVPNGTDSTAHHVYMMRVTDGDTFTLENRDIVRLAEVNAPEKKECYHEEATDEMHRMLEGVGLVVVKDAKATDNFDRLLRWVYLHTGDERADAVLLNEHMVREGFARLSPYGNNLHKRELEIAESEAKRKLRGLWGACLENADVKQNKRDTEERTLKKHVGGKKTGVNGGTNESRDSVMSDGRPMREGVPCVIKGNVSQNAYGKNYFLPTCRSYGGIKIDAEDGDRWFCAEEDAKRAGFAKSQNCFPRPVLNSE